jgi:signal transduction histidine kinase
MSLRLKLALAIATIAGLVAGVTGVVVYAREKADRFDRARSGVARTVRIYEKILDSPNPIPLPNVTIEGGESGVQRSSDVPDALRRRLVDTHVYSIITTSHGLPVVIAGVRLQSTSGRVYEIQRFVEDTQALKDLRVALIQVGVAAALLGALLGLLVSILLGRPLQRTAALARRIAGGDLKARLRPHGRDEIAQVGRALDEMAEALGAKIAELDEAAEREKRFSGDVAHELRTPVTGLVAAAALLDDSRPAAMVRERASALAALVEDLLEVMRLEAAGETPRVDPFDLVRLVGDVTAIRLPTAEIQAPVSMPVLSDPRRVERVVVNLLDNARRHGRAPVVVTVAARGSDALVEVRDAGDGFGSFLRHAGERFALAAPERGKGTGLGLAIARGQARILGGTLDLRDDGGAVVTLHLPGVVASRPRPDVVEVRT